MTKYKILQFVCGNYFKICELEAESKDQAISEFLEMNPSYKNRPVTAWKV